MNLNPQNQKRRLGRVGHRPEVSQSCGGKPPLDRSWRGSELKSGGKPPHSQSERGRVEAMSIASACAGVELSLKPE